jgi:preprotein translocase subunit SecG
MLNGLLMTLLLLTAIFLILLVLIQRGRGGGLAGAFGGLGGQSAFGTKAGDLFTRITIGVAAFWIVLCAVSVKLLNESSPLAPNLGGNASTGSSAPAPKGTEKAPGAAGGSKATENKADDEKDTATKTDAAKSDDGAAKAAPAESAPASSPPAATTSETAAPAADSKTDPAK